MKSRVMSKLRLSIPFSNSKSLLWRLLRESFAEHHKKYLVAVLAMVVVAGTTAMSAWIMGAIIDAMTDSTNRARVYWVSFFVLMIFMVKGFASFLQTVFMARAGNRIVAQMQSKLFRRLLKQGTAFFNTTESSDLLLRVTQSAQMARGVIDTIVTGFVRDLLTLLSLVAVMVYQQPFLSLVGLIVGPAAIYAVRLILKRVRLVMAQEMAGLAEIIKVVQEAARGARVVKAFSLEGRLAEQMDTAVASVEKRSNKMVRLEAATSPLMDTITGFAIAAIVLLSSVHLMGHSAGSPGQLMSFITAFLMAYEPAKRLSRMRVSIEAGMYGVTMMYDLIDQPSTMLEATDAKELIVAAGSVTLDNVHFAYDGDRSVLDGVSIVFEGGKTTALVGPSGSGKSTLLNLILRLYDPTQGRVLVDEQDIRHSTFASLRNMIAYVGQDTFLFSNTVMENIRLARPDATEAEIMEAAHVAHAHEFIEKLPHGYHTLIGENGTFLSGGQRQRLSIARAVLRRAPILLLDEATSSLDSHSEILILDALDRITEGVTTIVIAHRLSTILNADRICYLENGQLIETGTVSELLEKDGKFKKMYNTQFKE